MRSDIIIVGCGLIGGVAAIALAREGMSVQLIERGDMDATYTPQQDGRTLALAHGSVVILQNLGLWDTIGKKAEPILDIRVVDGDSYSYVHYDHKEAGNTPFGYIIEHEWLKHCFLDAVLAEQNIHSYAQAEVENIACDSFSAQLRLKNHEKPLNASLLLAADGRFSSVRTMMGITHKDMAYEQTAIVVAIKHEEPHYGIALERFTPAGPFAVLPLPGGHRSGVVWTESNIEAKTILALSKEKIRDRIQLLCGEYLGEIHIDGSLFNYPLKLTVTEKTIAGRAVLIGDSAHAIHPIAGQGVNLGYRDVAVLTELLSTQFHLGLDIGQQNILHQYARKRRLDVRSMTAATDGINRLFSNDLFAPKIARRIGLRAVEQISPAKQFFMRHAMGMTGTLPTLMQEKVG